MRGICLSAVHILFICKMVELDFTLRILLRSITELRGVVTVLANVTSYGLARISIRRTRVIQSDHVTREP